MQSVAPFTEVEQNLRESFRALAFRRPTGELREWPGLTIASLGVEFQMFNAAFLSAPVQTEEQLGRMVSLAAVHFQARGQKWALWACENFIPLEIQRRAWRVIERAGLRLGSEMPGMCAALPPQPKYPLPQLRFERVTGEKARRAFCSIGSSCFHVPPAWFEEVFDADLPQRSNFICWVGWIDQEPVTTAATVLCGESIGLYNLAVVPGCRRKGYAEATMRFALEQAAAASGLTNTVLQSTPPAIRLYERLGYRAVTRFRVYTS